jgi:hypothetical protein
VNNTILVTEIEEVSADIGEPDCKLINPYLLDLDLNLIPWLNDITKSNELMMNSDKILTIVEPKKTLLDKYLELTQ